MGGATWPSGPTNIRTTFTEAGWSWLKLGIEPSILRLKDDYSTAEPVATFLIHNPKTIEPSFALIFFIHTQSILNQNKSFLFFPNLSYDFQNTFPLALTTFLFTLSCATIYFLHLSILFFANLFLCILSCTSTHHQVSGSSLLCPGNTPKVLPRCCLTTSAVLYFLQLSDSLNSLGLKIYSNIQNIWNTQNVLGSDWIHVKKDTSDQ